MADELVRRIYFKAGREGVLFMSIVPRPPSGRDEAADIAGFVAEIKQVADQLLRHPSIDRGDVKLLARSFTELQDSLAMLARFRGRPKVSVFGSARTPATDVCYQQAVEFGRLIAARNYLVVTGAGPGIMEAAHLGAGREKSMGFNIRLPFEQGANTIVDGDEKLRTLNYFFTRKLLFLKETDAVVLFPGGYGTLDEGFEVLTLVQTGRAQPMPIVMIDPPNGGYWKGWKEFVERDLLHRGLISPEDMSLFRITDDVAEAVREIDRFYRVYHSQRYIGGRLILRLKKNLSDELFHRVAAEFSDILAPGGKYSRESAHRHEHNEPTIRDLPRLRIGFNRRAFGRLRQLIDLINDEA